MRNHLRMLLWLFLAMALLFMIGPLWKPAIARQAEEAVEYPPLPGGCGGILDPNDKPCCVSGYVFLDGAPVSGAQVTIRTGEATRVVWSKVQSNNQFPYYTLDPLVVQPGAEITIVAEYSGHRHEIRHTALAGAQRVDAVLARQNTEDYVAAGQIWQQGDKQRFAFPTGIAIDKQGTAFVADWANHRIQVYGSRGDYKFDFGVRGNEEGNLAGPIGVAVDAKGDIYVADSFNSRIQKFSNSGSFMQQWGSRGRGLGQFTLPSGIAIGPDGTVYVADAFNHNVQLFSNEGTYLSTIGAQGSKDGQFQSPVGVVVDNDGMIYVADRDNHRLQKFDPAGRFLKSFRGGQSGSIKALRYPEGLTLDGSGNLVVADWGNHLIQHFTRDGEQLDGWGTWQIGSRSDRFRGPRGVAVEAQSGTIYVTDNEHHRVLRFRAPREYKSQLGRESNSGGQFWGPTGTALDRDSNLYLSEWGGGTVQIFDQAGASVGALGGGVGMLRPTGIAIHTPTPDQKLIYVADLGDEDTATPGAVHRFDENHSYLDPWGAERAIIAATGVAVNRAGEVYVADAFLNHVVQLSADGRVLRIWRGHNGDFDRPFGVAVDSHGDVYVADSGNDRVQKFSASGEFIADLGSAGWADAFNGPAGLAVDGEDNIYVTEAGPLFLIGALDAHRIHKFNREGRFITTWGEPGSGPGQLVNPTGIVAEANGGILVVDTRNNRVQRFRKLSYDRPVATIVQVESPFVAPGAAVRLIGIAAPSVAGRTIVGYRWTLVGPDHGSRTVATAATATLDTTGLSVGRYRLSLVALDSAGQESHPHSTTLTISGAGIAPWAMLLYLDADTSPDGSEVRSLAPYLGLKPPYGALHRLQAQANGAIPVVALYDGPGPDDTVLVQIASSGLDVQKQPEANMGDPQRLVAFVTDGQKRAPALRYYLAIADHAGGLDGIAWDYTSDSARRERLELDELRAALNAITDGGKQPIDIVHLDGCLTGMLEVADQVREGARIVIASQSLAWGVFSYEQYRALLAPEIETTDVAKAIVRLYANALAEPKRPFTIAAIDTAQLATVNGALDALAIGLEQFARRDEPSRDKLLSLRARVQVLDSSGDGVLNADDDYVDLGDWATLVGSEVGGSLATASTALTTALDDLIIGEESESGQYAGGLVNLDRATGLAIYYPRRINQSMMKRYLDDDLRFTAESQWDEYLVALLAPDLSDPRETDPAPLPPLTFTGSRLYLPVLRR